MGWIQKHDANWRIPYVGGWCEGYVEGAWGQATKPTVSNQTTSGVHASAMSAWNAGRGNHPNEAPPKGKTVPVFFSLGSTPLGHVAIHMDDGMVASTTQAGFHTQGYLHPNLNHLINLYAQYNKGCTYLGWSEWVGNLKVLVWEDKKSITSTTEIPFSTETKEDPSILKGETKVQQEGKNGQRVVVSEVTTEDGVEVSRKVTSDNTTPAVTKIILVGTKVVNPLEPTNGEDAKSWLSRLLTWVLEMLSKFTFKK